MSSTKRLILLFNIIFLFIGRGLCQCEHDVDIWGPGIKPKLVFPARYFFVKFNCNETVTSNDLEFKITGDSRHGDCRLWQEILDRKDNSFIVRYRIYDSCSNLEINLKYKGKSLGSSPYYSMGEIAHEACDCPSTDYTSWAENYGCPAKIPQLDSDLKQFTNVDMDKILEQVEKHFNHPASMSLCHYTIKDNELYRKCYGQHVGFNMFSDSIFLSILRKVKLPDLSLFINLGDWPLAKGNMKKLPIFSWCGSDDTADIVFPTYDITESTLENMGRVMLDMLSVQGNIGKSWDEKIPLAFWRGRDASRERLKLVDIARENPSLFNVSLTNFFFFRDQEAKYGPKVPHVSFFKFFDYKYQINMDGTVAAYRFPYLLAGDSVVFKQDSHYYEHFYKKLKPFIHYIPFKRDLSDLTTNIKWAMENDERAKEIALNGQSFSRDNLMPKDIICYYAVAFNEWSKRLLNPVKVYPGMEKIPQPDQNKQHCPCFTAKYKDEL